MFETSLLLDVDSYKFSHAFQYPPNTTKNYAYLEARKGSQYGNIVFFGLQYYLMEYLSKPFRLSEILEAENIAKEHGVPFNKEGWRYIFEKHGGYLPLSIKAVPEGTVVPANNILMSVENTDPKCAWLTSYVETMLSRLWYPCTVATRSWNCRNIIKGFLDKTSDNPEAEIGFKLHDFGSRGVSSRETAAIGSAAHLVNFMGTDTVAGLMFLRKYYGAKMPGFSIPAAEHSTITAWGKDGEVEAYRNMIKQFGDGALVAVVSDSYDIYHAVEKLWGETLRQEVLDMNATLVIRPDSGDPVKVVGDIAAILAEKFGYEYNSKGYKVLNKVRIIQGDGMSEEMIRHVYQKLYDAGFAADNLAVGMGGGLVQKLDRDTCRFAYKTSYMEIAGKGVDIYKQPKTDSSKNSKRGKLSLVQTNGTYQTVPFRSYGDILEEVFRNGEVLKETTLDEIRVNVNRSLIRI